MFKETNLLCGKASLRDGWDVGGKEGCSLARGGWSLTMGSGVFSWILYNGMQVLLPCLFNIAAVVVHLEMSDHMRSTGLSRPKCSLICFHVETTVPRCSIDAESIDEST